MKRYPILVALLALALASGELIAIAHAPQGTVISVTALQRHLAVDPQSWVGRTVRVRGMVEPCPWSGGTARLWQCADDPLILVADPADQVAEPLPLSELAPDGILAVLRGLPLLHDLVARVWATPVFTPAQFRVQLHSLAAQACGGRLPCYEAVLLDAPSIRRFV